MTAHFAKPEQALATELLHEVKVSAKRWFIAFVIMIIVEALTIAGFLWYISISKEPSSYNQNSRQFNSNNSALVQNIGGDVWERHDRLK
jgi:hypothetical protein